MMTILQLLVFIYSVKAAATFCTPDKALCISALSSQQYQNSTCFSIKSTAKGWVGLGIGSKKMAGAAMYLGWKNSTKGTTLAALEGTGQTKPNPSTLQNGVLINDPTAKNDPNGISFAFCRHASASPKVVPTQNYIWAYSNTAPSSGSIDSPSASIGIHDLYGTFQLDFSINSTMSDNNTTMIGAAADQPMIKTTFKFTYQQMVDLHAVLMWVAWVICPFIGVFMARYLKSLGKTWFRIHMAILGITTFLLTGGSLVLVCLYRPGPHFDNIHSQLGLAVCVVMVVQIILGILCNHYYNAARTEIPWIDRFHHWLGRLLILSALVNIQFGFSLAKTIGFSPSLYIPVVHYIIIAMIAGLFIFAEIRVGPDSHYVDKSKMFNFESKTPLPLFDESLEKRFKNLEDFANR